MGTQDCLETQTRIEEYKKLYDKHQEYITVYERMLKECQVVIQNNGKILEENKQELREYISEKNREAAVND